MGTVYAAEEPTIRKRVAIKVLRRTVADDPSSAARFEREARAANGVHHPAVVEVFALGKLEDGRPYLAMSLLEGRPLREEIDRRGHIPPAEAWRYAREVATAMAAAHEAGVVHRDLKPDNVFLEGSGDAPPKVRVLDLGLAKLTRRGDDDDEEEAPMKLTRTGVPMGTPAYMAPEQWWGEGVDARADQYALGVTLFEMLTGQAPFRSQQFIELGQQHLHEAPPRIADAGFGVPAAVEAFVARALAKAPEDRFDSMTALIAAGDAAFGSGDTSAALAATVLSEPGSPVERPRHQPRAAPRVLAALSATTLAAIAALLGVGYAGAGRHNPADWIRSAGWSGPAIVVCFLAGLAVVFRAARGRALGRAPSYAPWILSLVTGLVGAVGTYTGWSIASAGVERMAGPERFVLLHQGMYEANVSRFLGFFFAAILMTCIAVSVGADFAAEAKGRGEALGAGALFLGLAALSTALGAPSGAVCAGAAAVLVAVAHLVPTRGGPQRLRDEIERAVASILALALVFTVGVARVEARQAVLWAEQPTRAARAAEVVAAADERSATLAIGVVTLVLFLGLVGVRLRRIWSRGAFGRPRATTAALLVVIAVVGVGDSVQYARFASLRERVRAELEAQFSLFARLDPPSSGELDPKRHAPHRAPALQIARTVVAVNGRPVAPVSAAESGDGAIHIGREVSRALAEHAAAAETNETDLAVAVDREVPGAVVTHLLGIARRSGARRIEILLTRGPGMDLPPSAPPEASWVLAADFVAVTAQLAEEGFGAAPEDPFSRVAPQLVQMALESDAPIHFSVAP
jgi:serine/threonine-protein kinase